MISAGAHNFLNFSYLMKLHTNCNIRQSWYVNIGWFIKIVRNIVSKYQWTIWIFNKKIKIVYFETIITLWQLVLFLLPACTSFVYEHLFWLLAYTEVYTICVICRIKWNTSSTASCCLLNIVSSLWVDLVTISSDRKSIVNNILNFVSFDIPNAIYRMIKVSQLF